MRNECRNALFIRAAVPNLEHLRQGHELFGNFRVRSSALGVAHVFGLGTVPRVTVFLANKRSGVTGQDVWLGLLALRNTPTTGMSSSPVESLMSRQTRTPLNVSSKPLQPRVIDRHKVDTEISEKQSQQRRFYNRTAKPMYCLNPSDYVWIQLEPADQALGKSQPWVRGTVKERTSNLICLSDGTIVSRNRRYLRPAVSLFELLTTTH